MNRHVEALTQSEQDRIENGDRPHTGLRLLTNNEPPCPICNKGTLIKKSADTV